uniref:Putative ovule protein n=1 Tax=Solanum chacoense TaxID=4108 RepID=A0A0V0GY20_SOLCH
MLTKVKMPLPDMMVSLVLLLNIFYFLYFSFLKVFLLCFHRKITPCLVVHAHTHRRGVGVKSCNLTEIR